MLHKMWSYKNEVGSSSIPVLINTFVFREVLTNIIFEIGDGIGNK